MRAALAIGVLASVVIPAPAGAQPLSYQLKPDVPRGEKPLMRIKAEQNLEDLRIDLERHDGKHFRQRRARLPRGKSVVISIGDGRAGKASYQGTLSARVSGRTWTRALDFETLVRAPLSVSYDRDHLHLDRRVLEFKLSEPAARAELVVIGEDGRELGTGSTRYENQPAGKWLAIRWKQPPGKRVMKMRLRAVAQNGLESTVELIPWSVTVDHEDVNFPTSSAAIEAPERAKLDASLERIREIVARSGRFMKMKLYIAGHTDTVGSAADNRELSQRRARAIARYFRRKGLRIPIAYAGFGEQILAVKTPDDTDSAANRRVDYVIGPRGGEPPFSSAYRRAGARWRQLR